MSIIVACVKDGKKMNGRQEAVRAGGQEGIGFIRSCLIPVVKVLRSKRGQWLRGYERVGHVADVHSGIVSAPIQAILP